MRSAAGELWQRASRRQIGLTWRSAMSCRVAHGLVHARTLAEVHETRLTVLVLTILWIPLLAGISVAVDYGRALKVRSELQDAADAAVTVAASMADKGELAMVAALRMALDQNLRRNLRGLSFVHVVTADRLALRIDARVSNYLASVAGKQAFHFAITSEASLAVPAPVSQDAQPPVASQSPTGDDSEAEEAEMLLDRARMNRVRVTSGR